MHGERRPGHHNPKGILSLALSLNRQGHPAEGLVCLGQRADIHTQTTSEVAGMGKGRIIGWAHLVLSGHLSGAYVDSQT